MNIVDVKTAATSPNPHNVDARRLCDTEHAQVVQLTLKPGEALKPHITQVDVFFYVLEGEGVIEIGDERRTVGSDTLIDSPANTIHCWYNESDAPVRFLVVKVPRPTNPTRVL